MKILRMIGTLDPQYGGPVEALKQSVQALEDVGIPNHVLTLDPPDAAFLAPLQFKAFALGPSYGVYKLNSKLVPWLLDNAQDYDAVVVHGIWQFQSLAAWMAHKIKPFPYFVFIHGALDPWFKEQYPLKHVKKSIYWLLAEHRAVRNARALLFTSQEELLLARKSFRRYQVKEEVVHYGIQEPPGDEKAQIAEFNKRFPQLSGKHILLFLGRLHPKKGCDILIRSFAEIAADNPEMVLVVAGPHSGNYLDELKSLARELGIENKVIFTGGLYDALKWGAYRSAEVFILPSHSENFGVAVVEALACSLPVIISDKVNIWREIEGTNSGLVCADDQADLTKSLGQWVKLPDNERQQYRQNAATCFHQNFNISQNATDLIDVINSNLG